MNGLQSLPYWKEYFGNPTGGKLGLLNAIQVRIRLLSLYLSLMHNPRILVPWQPTLSHPTSLMALGVDPPSSLVPLSCASPPPFKPLPSP